MHRTEEKQRNIDTMKRLVAGDEDAFREVLELYKDPLYSFLRRFLNDQNLVEDVFQETFLQLYTSRETFNVERPLKPWLFTIAANKAKDALRKIKRTSSISLGAIGEPGESSIDDVLNSITSFEQTPDDDVLKEETAVRVRKLISEMPENLRTILVLAFFKQFSYKQMAEILEIPIGTVKSRLHSAVVQFTKRWNVNEKENQ